MPKEKLLYISDGWDLCEERLQQNATMNNDFAQG